MLKIRLRRMGSRHRPFYRIVVSDSRRTPLAAALDELGYYDPRKSPATLNVDVARVDDWVSKGAKPSKTVERLIHKARVGGDVTPAEEAAAATEAPAPAPPVAEKPADEKPAEPEASSDGKSAEETPEAEASSDDKPAAEAPEAEASSDDAAEAAADEGSEKKPAEDA